eukprot:scaffold6677_cov155-Skeletonema_menzelii.AAC.17
MSYYVLPQSYRPSSLALKNQDLSRETLHLNPPTKVMTAPASTTWEAMKMHATRHEYRVKKYT